MPSTTTDASRLRGIGYMVGAAFLFSLMSVFVKLVGQHLPSQQLVFARAILTLGYSYALIRWAGLPSVWGVNRRGLWIRGLFGFGAITCFFYALTELPLADATVLHYTNPVFTSLIAALVLDERLTPLESGSVLLSLSGVALITQPSFLFGGSESRLDPFAVMVALLGALLAACAYVMVRKLRETEHPLVIVFYFPLVATLGSAPTMTFTDLQWPTGWEWVFLIVGVGGCAQGAQILLTKGLHAVKAGRAMSISYLQIVFAAIWGILAFNEIPNLLSVVGATLVIAGTVFIAKSKG